MKLALVLLALLSATFAAPTAALASPDLPKVTVAPEFKYSEDGGGPGDWGFSDSSE